MIKASQLNNWVKYHLKLYKIGKGLAEYERAKRLILVGDFESDEYERAIVIISEWCGV